MSKRDGKKKNAQNHPPDSYKPKQRAVIETPQTDPAILWNGLNGIMEIQGMRFRSSKNKLDGERCGSPQISVLSAPAGTELYGLAGSSIYVTVLKLRLPTFQSNFPVVSVDYKRQERLWNFLNKVFIETGLKQAPAQRKHAKPMAVRERCHSNKQNTKVSSSIDDLVSGVLGRYSFEKNGEPQAYFQMKTMEYTSYKAREKKQVLIVEAVSVSPGHKLYDYVRTKPRKPFVFHDQLSRDNVPNFKGDYAGDSEKMWEFLTELIAKHRKNVLGGETGFVPLGGEVVEGGAEVIYLADRRAA